MTSKPFFTALHTRNPASSSPGADSTLFCIGPVLLALTVGLQFMFWAWAKWDRQEPSQATTDQLTLLGKTLYRPDYDMPIYLGGLLLCLLMAQGLGAIWSRRLDPASSTDDLRSLRLLALMHLPVAVCVALVRLLDVSAPPLSLIAASAGLMFCAAALWTSWRPALSPVVWQRARTVARLAFRRRLRVPARPSSSLDAGLGLMQTPNSVRRCAESAFVIAAVFLIVYIPQPERLVALAYSSDHFHHLDFYAMAPALAFRHGLALGTDFYSQYGVGWPMILAFLSNFTALSYKLLFAMIVTWGCLYFGILYVFLRQLLDSWAWAMTGLLIALLLQLLSGAWGQPKWLWPSSTVARYSMDVLVFSACLLHARSGRPWLGLPAGIFAAIAVLLGTETGVYLLVCLALYPLAVLRMPSEAASPRSVGGFVALALLGFSTVLICGLTIASRGTLLRPEFWLGWTESLRIYNHGFSHLPVAGAIAKDWKVALLLVLMLTFYLFAVSRACQEFACRRLSPGHLIVGLIGAYGLAILLLFIGRSHPYNLLHTSIPFCIVLTSLAVESYDGVWPSTTGAKPPDQQALWCATRSIVPVGFAFAALLGIYLHPAFENYPNVRWWLHQKLTARTSLAATDLFASRRDGPLANDLREDVLSFRAVTSTMRELSDSGRKSVAMIDGADTAYLVEADLRPHFRYSPVIASLAFNFQVELLANQISDQPPDYLLLPLEAPMMIYGVRAEDTHQRLLAVVQTHFTFDRQVATMAVYRRGTRVTANGQ